MHEHEYKPLPPIFDQFGALILLSERDMDEAGMTDAQHAAYDRVRDSYDDVAELEKKIEATTKQLHATTASMRECEGRIAQLPKISRIDLVRSDLIAMN